MPSYLQEYKQKLVTAAEAVKVVKSGDWVEHAFGVCGANELDQALAQRVNELYDVKIRVDIGVWPHYSLEADPTGEHFQWHAWHFGGLDRKYYNQGQMYYVPMKFHECPRMTRNDCAGPNVFMATVAPMDRHGYFSFGAGAPSAMAAAETADYVLLEINTNMPRVLGGNQEHIHISQVDYVVESSNQPLPTLPAAEPSEVEKIIAGHIIERLYDGCCIQLGIGGIPNAIGTMVAESDLKDLGVHTEMYVDAYLKMTEAGKITGAKKNLDRYKQVFSFALGSRELYEFIDDNPGVIAYSVDYTNNPYIVAQIDNFVSINACIEVDLFGQVCAESVGTRHISGTGGQLDFVEGAYKSKNGQSFICMPSTFESQGQVVSRIKPILTPGSIVTDPRTATHMVVTEYGIANMKGKSTWERAEALINIAHPGFRDELINEAESMRIWRRSNRIPSNV
ncbi:MAG TPA: acetyl-CoA hydrolase/transferase C-terminal domain-containing protein [Syntrophomonadaceae bacterium]|nr:acetyl-CoA hydrolase/transferase C-terminal domain-containing protein [Syntrophomonadaceae bacterium]HQA07529.1 acetyl-CoA hydrolase/transferase C-terminal domain-containing protein [Syntrophomonadaceae bacterium]HQE22268.1 acetyl-CoA hydrolase/transferase C-terminal domain-containing protein [Syntrophomonadaceae bacterium]